MAGRLLFDHCVHTPLGTWVAIRLYPLFPSTVRFWCLAWVYPRPRLTYRLSRCYSCSATVPAAHLLHAEGLEGFGEDVRLAGLKIHSPRGCRSCRGHGVVRGKGALRACAHPSRVHPSAGLPFPDKFSNALGLVSGQIDHDRMDARGIRKVLGPVSAAGTAPCKGSVRRWGTYGSSVSHDLGTVAEISPFCECLNMFCARFCFVCFQVYDAAASGTCNACATSANCGHTPLYT